MSFGFSLLFADDSGSASRAAPDISTPGHASERQDRLRRHKVDTLGTRSGKETHTPSGISIFAVPDENEWYYFHFSNVWYLTGDSD